MGVLLPFDDAERNLNAKLMPQLQSIHASLKLNSEVTATNVYILTTLLDDIRIQMKQEDPLFRRLFKRLEYTGSYYDGLRTKKADEFDINLVLDLPFKKDEFTVSDECPGYVGYVVGPAAVDRLMREEDTKWVRLLRKWMDGENRLVPDMVKRWLQSVFDRVLRTYVVPSGSCLAVDKIRSSQQGPAMTLHIGLKDGTKIDVDLVPVVEFCDPGWPKSIQKKDWMAKMSRKDRNWFLIPKPPVHKSHLWRLHFPNMEKRLIEDYGCVKPIIRLLKATRDSHMWNLSSYSLKTFVMSQVVANYDSRYWHPNNQGMLFVRDGLFAFHRASAPHARPRLSRCGSTVEGRKLALGARQLKNHPAVINLAVTIVYTPWGGQSILECMREETKTESKVLDCLGHVLAQPGPAISFLFHPEVDLTERVTRETRDNISCRIKRIVRKLRLSPDQCYELVLKNQRKGRASSDSVVGDVALNNIRNIVSNDVQLLMFVDLETYLGPDKLNEILAAVKESLESSKQYKKETMDKLREINAGIRDINSRVAQLESINEIAEIKEYLLEVNAAIFKVKTLVNIISQA